MKHKRVWTDEQRQAAAERARARFTKKLTATESAQLAIGGQQILEANIESGARDMGSISTVTLAPEVEADQRRKAKLAEIQAQNLARLGQTKEGREALERLEARHGGTMTAETPKVPTAHEAAVAFHEKVQEHAEAINVPPKPIVREIPMKAPFRLTGSQSGLMISELGPCVCGEAKLKWHAICLRVKVHG